MKKNEFHLTIDLVGALPLSEIIAFSVFEEADRLLIYPDAYGDGSLIPEINSHFADINKRKLVAEFKKAGIPLVEITGRRNEPLWVREDRLDAVQASLDAD